MAFKEMNGAGSNGGTVLKWNTVGQVVEGRLVATKRGKVFNGRPTTLAIVKQADGVDVTFPLTTVLESRFIENSIAPGQVIRVTYTGKETSATSKMEYKAFKLEVDDQGVAAPAPVAAPQNVTGPTPAEIEAAKAMLAKLGQPVVQVPALSEYDRLLALLNASNPKGAAAIKGALEGMFPEGAERLDALKNTLVQQGIKVDG